MRIRTVNDLFDRIAEDQSWRKKEVSIFAQQVSESDVAVRPALLRPAVALLYAHWEGFIKNALFYYLVYLNDQKIPLKSLRAEIAARCVRGRISAAATVARISPHVEVISYIRSEEGNPARIPILRSDVDTGSNLTFEVLSDLLMSVALSSVEYLPFQGLVDEHLVGSRNKIAHGESHYIEMEQWVELRHEIFELMDQIAFQIVEAAESRAYLATA